jgi:predicted kinase
MDGKRGGVRRRLCRVSEPTRLEEEVLALAYEGIWPLVRKALENGKPAVLDEVAQRLARPAGIARRA